MKQSLVLERWVSESFGATFGNVLVVNEQTGDFELWYSRVGKGKFVRDYSFDDMNSPYGEANFINFSTFDPQSEPE